MAGLNGKYVNEENHQKVKTKLQKAGYFLLAFGAVFTVVGIILLILGFTSTANFGASSSGIRQGFSSFGFFMGGGILLAIGLGMLTFGVYASFFAHAREIGAYGASSVAPVIGETATYLADETSPAIQKVTSAISNGIRGKQPNEKTEEQSQAPKENIKYCSECGAKNARSSKFCTTCGNKFPEDKSTTK